MRNTKKVFWLSIIVFFISLIFIYVSSYFNNDTNHWDIVLNVFIGLISGAFLSATTSYISFMQTKKDYQIKFYSNVVSLNNMLLDVLNWYQWNYEEIDYKKTIDTSNLSLKQIEKAHHLIFDKMDNHVKDFVYLIENYKKYNYDDMVYILDDYRGLLKNKKNEIKQVMISIRNLLNKYNIVYYSSMMLSYTLYKMGRCPEVAIYNDVIVPLLRETDIKDEELKELLNLRKKYLELTNLVYYTKKQQ